MVIIIYIIHLHACKIKPSIFQYSGEFDFVYKNANGFQEHFYGAEWKKNNKLLKCYDGLVPRNSGPLLNAYYI